MTKDTTVRASDGLENVVTGLGTAKDKSSFNQWSNSYRNLDHEQLIARYREDWVSQKVCNIIPQDMTRKWRKVSTSEGQEADEELRVRDLFRDAYKYARLLGTSFIVLDIKGSGTLDKPLNLKRLKAGCINGLQVIDRTRIFPTGVINYDNPMSCDYGMPEFYQFMNSTTPIHSSRLIRFDGTDLPLYQKWNNQYWGDSTLIPLMNTIDNFHVAADSASSMCQEALTDVVSVDGLQDILTNPAGEMALMKRMRLMKMMKSNHNILLLDNGTEEFDTKTINLNSIRELVWEYLRIIAASVGIPATRFLSASPDGLNSSGASDMINYIEMLHGLQRSMFDPKLKVLDELVSIHYGIEDYSFEWNDIFPESDVERVEKFSNLSSTLSTILAESQLLSPEEARTILVDHFRSIEPFVDPKKIPPNPNPPITNGGNNNNATKD